MKKSHTVEYETPNAEVPFVKTLHQPFDNLWTKFIGTI
ncbi:putative ORFan [Tupanvirus deep ocean]|uniref:ORFan n=2 Tax=Tupanvirus TaxID=2094720 RepID=A0AC62A9J8_9VIRU|nr:putative ORFan [Tupanvirus deep ocean]QKU34457.1 putative ORFan [Tupanvirus deep ocean]